MTKAPFDYLKLFLGIFSVFATVIVPIAIGWLVKNFKSITKSNATNEALNKKLAEESKKLESKNTEFKNELQKKLNDAISKLNYELDRKTGLTNYELDRNRKGIDSLCDRLLSSSDRFDKKVQDATTRLESEMITKSVYYQETSKFKDEFLRDLLLVKTNLQTYTPASPDKTNVITKDLLSLNKKVETLNNKFDNEKIANDKKHKLTRRLLSVGLSDRKQLEIKYNNLKVNIKSYRLETGFKLDNYNKLLNGLKDKQNKK
jgi:hypothetical protein